MHALARTASTTNTAIILTTSAAPPQLPPSLTPVLTPAQPTTTTTSATTNNTAHHYHSPLTTTNSFNVHNRYNVKRAADASLHTVETLPVVASKAVSRVFSNGVLEVTVDTDMGHITQVRNLESNLTTPFRIDWGW
jgi:hypothetical protein